MEVLNLVKDEVQLDSNNPIIKKLPNVNRDEWYVSMNLYVESVTAYQGILGNGINPKAMRNKHGNRQPLICIYPDNKLGIFVTDTGGKSYEGNYTSNPLSTGEWINIIVSQKGTVTELYLNGVLDQIFRRSNPPALFHPEAKVYIPPPSDIHSSVIRISDVKWFNFSFDKKEEALSNGRAKFEEMKLKHKISTQQRENSIISSDLLVGTLIGKLCEKCDKDTCKTTSSLMNAAIRGHLKCVKYFHSMGIPLFYSEKGKDGRMEVGQNAANFSASYGWYDCLVYVLDNGCPINYNKETLLPNGPFGKKEGYFKCIELLCKRGLINLTDKRPSSIDYNLIYIIQRENSMKLEKELAQQKDISMKLEKENEQIREELSKINQYITLLMNQ